MSRVCPRPWLAAARFGRLFSTAVNGQIYAQPLAVGGSVIVATENNWIYSLNAEKGTVNWSLRLGPAWPSTVVGCEDLTPNVGVTSTPVYDPSTGTVYVAAELNNAANAYAPSVDLFAVNAVSGTVDWKVPVQGAPVNEPTRPFDPLTERQRASLLLLNGTVYMGFRFLLRLPALRRLCRRGEHRDPGADHVDRRVRDY